MCLKDSQRKSSCARHQCHTCSPNAYIGHPSPLKVILIPHQKILEMLVDSLELHTHSMCKEVLPKSCLAHLPFICKNKFRLGKQTFCLVQNQSALLASQPGISWSHSDIFLIKSIASRPHCILHTCVWCYYIFSSYLLMGSSHSGGYEGNMGGGKLS